MLEVTSVTYTVIVLREESLGTGEPVPSGSFGAHISRTWAKGEIDGVDGSHRHMALRRLLDAVEDSICAQIDRREQAC